MSVEIVYETHSLTTDNEAGIATGWLPGRLSAHGSRLAAELGARRREDNFAAVFVSDLRRAVETAEIAFAGSTVPVLQDARLRECNYGSLNGMPVARLAAARLAHIDTPFPEGQSYRQVVAQMADFLRDLARRRDGNRVLLISHSVNKWSLDCLLGGKRLEDLVCAPFEWQDGWRYTLPGGWAGPDA
jgi:alpha-ribazole phosphatase/probable phosphoglycerate mutase